MRRRLLVASLAMLAAAIVAFAIPLFIAVRGLLIARALESPEAIAQQVGRVIEQQPSCGRILLLFAASASDDTHLSLWTGGPGVYRLLAAIGPVPEQAPGELDAAVQGRVVGTHRDGQLVVAQPLDGTACGARTLLYVSRPDDEVRGTIRSAWLGLGALAVAVLALAAAVAARQGRRLAEPFEDLAVSARRLGEGDFTARAPRSGLPEADAIASALDTTAERLGRAAARASAFTADASHQLRTPLTALRLQLEALEDRPGDAEAVDAALVEVDRLAATIDELVALTRVEGTDEEVDLGQLVDQHLAAWRPIAREQGRELRFQRIPTPAVRVRPQAIGQALQVLLDNALEHGQGTVTVRVGPGLPDGALGPGAVRICVSDEGSGPPVDAGPVGAERDRGGGPLPLRGGRGLVLARSLVEAEGGRLVIGDGSGGGRVCIVLPGL